MQNIKKFMLFTLLTTPVIAEQTEKRRAECKEYQDAFFVACNDSRPVRNDILNKLAPCAQEDSSILTRTQSEKTETLLHAAVVNRDANAVEKLLAMKDADANEADQDGYSLLMIAAYRNYPEICELLLKAGANPNAKDCEGTALHHAYHSPEATQVLLAHNADHTITHDFKTPLEKNIKIIKINWPYSFKCIREGECRKIAQTLVYFQQAGADISGLKSSEIELMKELIEIFSAKK